MKMLYRVKSFGRYYYFKTEQERDAFISSLDEVTARHCELETYELGGK